MKQVNIEFTSEIVSSYKRLSYKVWYALAEFIDNSTQAYRNNKEILDEVYIKDGDSLEVLIDYKVGKQLEDDFFVISDNSIGMNESDLESAFKIGTPPPITDGRSRYGLGMKTAAFWLGDKWSIRTKKLGHDKVCIVHLDVNSISGGNLILDITTEDAEENEHYTIIEINNLHRRFKGRTIGKIKEFLSSIYRFDIQEKELSIYWNREQKLDWINYSDDDFITNIEGTPYKKDFTLIVGGKTVKGWAGALKSGGRAKGGFALIQSKRVIQGPPRGYKPENIFGEQEGGINNLINQRIVGEIYLEGFKVSHTKDSILWEGTEEDELDDLLLEEIGYLRKVAEDFRAREVDERAPSDIDIQAAIDELLNEIVSDESQDIIFTNEVPSDEVIATSNRAIMQYIAIEKDEAIYINVGKLDIRLYIKEDMSPNDPYVLYDPISEANTVIIIVNKRHPFWNELDGDIGVLNYLRQCVYDGVAEWKAFIQKGKITAETVKYIKDDLMRLPFEIEKNKS
ncbi:ATP-binding protein [Aquimarina sp. 2201CG14-23]|uniref:ATP-binding protein n=1 Tax=Aquimarina mycalae TaxID=3040073 RepID=UPI002477F92A|nr:ATP-binding protein [Aquimarina sp. 2201CG14-23]MDH7448430.1 ATP-binding protein [Aquimarina sp. 2201CG14-23]